MMKAKKDMTAADIEILYSLCAQDDKDTSREICLDIFLVKPWGLVTVNYYTDSERQEETLEEDALEALTENQEEELVHIRRVLNRSVWDKALPEEWKEKLREQLSLLSL